MEPGRRGGDGLLLASASPRRRELLAAIGLVFEIAAADLDEQAIAGDRPPGEAAARVAVAKARALARPDRVVLAADTMVVLDDAILGKPADPADARRMLAALGGREHQVVTGVALSAGGGERAVVRWSTVRMRAYGPAEIDAYVTGGGGADKAGAYGIQDEPFRPVAAITGCWCNVMGLPLWTAHRLLADAGRRAPKTPDGAFARCATCPLATDDGRA